MRWFDAARTRLRLLFGRKRAESRMEREIRFHIDMETERLMRHAGLDEGEARRQALVAFGGVEKHKEELRADRGAAWISGMSLDLRLGLRMLAKYPGLTIVGVVGMAVAVAFGAVAFSIVYTVVDPDLPLENGDRIVAIWNDDARGRDAGRTHLHDLVTWEEALSRVDELGAYRTLDRNLITRDGRPEPVRVAEMTPSGFRIAGVRPVLGRHIADEDARRGAPPVAVIGHSVWQTRFGGDPGVIGRPLQLGATIHTVIGVMPEGFAFPINNRVWTPLRLDPAEFPRGQAPWVEVFGRLAPAASLDEAKAQIATIGRNLASTYPATHEHIRPRVERYAHAFLESPELARASHLVQLFVSMLLVVIGTNVAILVFARTANRTGEIAVRTALGASRGRIVAQFFAEGLILSLIAAAVGVVIARFALEQINTYIVGIGGDQLPFWMDFGVTPGVLAYAAGLAVVGAVIIGVIPALKSTGRHVSAGLKQLGTGGSGLRLGRTWMVMIVAQVALAVAILPVAVYGLTQWVRYGMADPGPATREFLTASLFLDREVPASGVLGAPDEAFAARYAARQAELVQRIEAEPAVTDVVLTTAVPTAEPTVDVEIERARTPVASDSASESGALRYNAGLAQVELDFFETLDVSILTGRRFVPGDLAGGPVPVIVNRAFVEKLLGGADPLGSRIRMAADDDDAEGQRAPWSEIVGVASDYPRAADPAILRPRMYQPMRPGVVHPVTMLVRVRGDAPTAFYDRLRTIALEIDPMLRLRDMATLEEGLAQNLAPFRLVFLGVSAVTLAIILLSSAGIYALMSFTITRRRREIGIRTALGAGSHRVLATILSRALGQVAIGIVVGVVLAGAVNWAGGSDLLGGHAVLVLSATAALMAIIGLLASIGPARQGLRIQPTEALKGE